MSSMHLPRILCTNGFFKPSLSSSLLLNASFQRHNSTRRIPLRAWIPPKVHLPTSQMPMEGPPLIKWILKTQGHRTWGLVIYRCTYKSDPDWAEFMRRYKSRVIDYLQEYDSLDMLDSFEMTVFQDKSFDGATTTLVRDHFNDWAMDAPQQEQNTEPSRAVRYRFCIHVNDEALESIVRNPDPVWSENYWKDNKAWGFVNVIEAEWEPYSRFDGEDEIEEEEEPIEGCTNHNVGWMRVRSDHVLDLVYIMFQDDLPDSEYVRPPKVSLGFILP